MNKLFKQSTIKIKNVTYFRDLGGIATIDGKHIKHGLIYKTSHLASIDDEAKDIIANKLKIGMDIDLRSPSELADKPEQVISGVEYVHIPVLGDDDNPAVNRKSRNEVLKNNMAEEGGSRGHITRIYEKMVTSQKTIDHYASFLRKLIANNGMPTIYHCTQGKDRTGIATMLLLLVLGVDKEVIMQDYLYYNVVNRRLNNLYTFGVTVGCFSIRKARGLRNLLVARREYLEAAFKRIEETGGIKAFITSKLGLSEEEIESLKNIYLE